jgi:hypothetical protein
MKQFHIIKELFQRQNLRWALTPPATHTVKQGCSMGAPHWRNYSCCWAPMPMSSIYFLSA